MERVAPRTATKAVGSMQRCQGLLLSCVAVAAVILLGSVFMLQSLRWGGANPTVHDGGSRSGASELLAAVGSDQNPVLLHTRSRGLLNLNGGSGARYLLVQCHRGQFSNRMMCVKRALLLSRLLNRTFVMPVFTDSDPAVDVSKYLNQECFRRNGAAVSFAAFQDEVCGSAGLPPATAAATAAAGAHGAVASFCAGDDAVLQISNGISLLDYSGQRCYSRHEDIRNAKKLGIQVKGCTHIDPTNSTGGYPLQQLQSAFGSRTEKALMFLDLFGVDLLPDPSELASTLGGADELCGMLPPEAANEVSEAVMRILVSGSLGSLSQGGAASNIGPDGAGRLMLSDVQSAGSAGNSDTVALRAQPYPAAASPRYLAAHVRRSDWFYYCAGKRQCFHSIALVARCLSATLARLGYSAIYIATNADARERDMMRAGITGRVIFWDEVAHTLLQQQQQRRSWRQDQDQNQGHHRRLALAAVAAAGAEGQLLQRRARKLLQEQLQQQQQSLNAALGNGGGAAADQPNVDLDDSLMVQILEKTICMQASVFLPSAESTFSQQIIDYRNGGLTEQELRVLSPKGSAISAAADPASGGVTFTASGASGAAAALQPIQTPEAAFMACTAAGTTNDGALYSDVDTHHIPDFFNLNLFLQQLQTSWRQLLGKPIRREVMQYSLIPRAWRSAPEARGGSAGPTAAAAGVQDGGQQQQQQQGSFRALNQLAITLNDNHLAAAANRFVQMYTGGSYVALVLDGGPEMLTAAPAELAACVGRTAAEARAPAVYVSFTGVPQAQQALIMGALQAEPGLQQVTRLYDAEQERHSTFTKLWRGDGLGRHDEPALLQAIEPASLERVDAFIGAKALVLIGNPEGAAYQRAMSYRQLYGFGSVMDGSACPDNGGDR